MENTVTAWPSKTFFVKMLTRDIELTDAILDLLDNCIDGILRQSKDKEPTESFDPDKPYDGYWAKITATPEEFSIKDNCGGISRDIAINKAFRLGRSKADLVEQDKNIATIGMYGIGMKRALFKMGEHSKVISRHSGDLYCVEISKEWLNNDDWELTLNDIDNTSVDLDSDGTSITVSSLHLGIADQFDTNRNIFLTDLKTEITNLFALIIGKGFQVSLNGEIINPASLDILFPKDLKQDEAIKPYAYKATIKNVKVELAVGFYRELASASELDADRQVPRRADNAGWTIICNDRVVLHRDKTLMTGWGMRNVPKYHTQFIAIGGVVRFSSDDSFNLPLNTTKRGLDTSSSIYWQTLDRMMEGLKKFTDFTNQWKGQESETKRYFQEMVPKDVTKVAEAIPQEAWNKVRKSEGERFTPNLPKPPLGKRKCRITFVRPEQEVEVVGEYLFDDIQATPAEIGNRCFEDILKKAKEDV